MVTTRRTNSTPVTRHPQTNDDILRSLHELVLSIDQRVKRHDDILAARNVEPENDHTIEEEPSDKQSGGDHHGISESRGSSGTQSQRPSESITQVWSNFRKFNPPKFEGKPDPAEAVEWIKQLEKIFKIVVCTSQQKVLMAEQFM